MEIRFAKAKDIPGIISLLKQVGQVHYQGRPDLFQPNAQKYNADQLKTLLKNPNMPVFVAVEGDTLLGYGFCQLIQYKNAPVIADHKELYIDDLCVDENTRGKGVGKAVYHHILRYAKEQGCYNVTLNVWACNKSAMKFYEAMGLAPQKIGMEQILDAE